MNRKKAVVLKVVMSRSEKKDVGQEEEGSKSANSNRRDGKGRRDAIGNLERSVRTNEEVEDEERSGLLTEPSHLNERKHRLMLTFELPRGD